MTLYDPAIEAILSAQPSETVTANGTSIPYPYPSPRDWRDYWIYFLLVDRFNNPDGPPQPDTYPCNLYQGGNFEGIKAQLPYLKQLGVGALWISPVLINPQWFGDYWGGYGTLDFIRIEPRFCSNPAQARQDPDLADREFRTLVDEAHALGIYVILDIVLNHTGDVFDYEGARDTAPWKEPPPYKVYWRDEHGQPRGNWTDISTVPQLPRDGGIWPREFQHNEYFRRQGGNDHQGDFSRMKELATDYFDERTGTYPVRNYLIRAYQYLIARFDLDGYRIDTLQYVETDFARVFGNAMREYALSIGKKNFFTFGEVWQDHDEARIAEFIGRNTEKDHEFIGVDAAIDFPMRSRLVQVCKGFAPPEVLAHHFDYRRTTLKKIVSSHGDAGRHYVTFLDNHDLEQRFHNKAFPDQTKLALACLMTMQGIPCIYYGTEQGLDGAGDRREYAREALWGLPGAFDDTHELHQFIGQLTQLRNSQPPLRYGRQYFRPLSGNGIDFGYSPYPGGVLAFSRILNDRELLVVANTNTSEKQTLQVAVDAFLNPEGRSWEILFPAGRQQPGITTRTSGPVRTVTLTVSPMELLVLG